MVERLDLTGVRVGSVIALEYAGNGVWKCQCKCGEIIKVKTHNLKKAIANNKNYMCENCKKQQKHKEASDRMIGQVINSWEILEYVGDGMFKCRCKCGDEHIINGKSIRRGDSKSCRKCGSKTMLQTRLEKYGDIATNAKCKRSKEQVEACMNRAELEAFILKNFSYKPNSSNLSKALGISECMTLRKIHKFGLEHMVDIVKGSGFEDVVHHYIKSIYNGEIVRNDRSLLTNRELDIYLPDKNLAIEVNGDYWHSTVFKDNNYHQNKCIMCGKKGVQLIQIFQREWGNDETKNKLKQLLRDRILQPDRKIYARKCKIVELVDNVEYSEFLNKYHLQNSANASIRLACYYGEELLGIMSFGSPRFTGDFEYELIRLCWKPGVAVIGGVEKLFKYFVTKYSPASVITYSDLSKFTGTVYLKIGFKLLEPRFSEPNYKWVKYDNHHVCSVLSRYQTQKHKLVEQGLGTELETEDEIMEKLGYFKVYDSGNLRLAWYREE